MKTRRKRAFIIPLALCIAFSVQTNSYARDAESEAEIKFVPGAGPTYPVNPEDPNTNEGETPVGGSLAIVIISRFDFGTIPVTAATQFNEITSDTPNIQVVDLRGTATGWSISATVSRFTDGTQDTLPGAVIHIQNGRPNSLSTSVAPVQVPDTRLTTDEIPVSVMTAGSGAGMGLWVMRWYPPADEERYIKLEIPAGSATVGDHTATINWILEDTP